MTSAIIKINGIQIAGVYSYQKYFSFEQVYALLRDKPQKLRAFFVEAFPQQMVTDLFGSYDPQGNLRSCAPASLPAQPDACLKLGGGMLFSPARDKGMVTMCPENLAAYVAAKYRRYWDSPCKSIREMFYADPPTPDRPKPEQMEAYLHSLLDELTGRGARIFTYEGASEVFLWCLLCMQARALQRPQCLSDLEADLNRLLPMTNGALAKQRNILFQQDLVLPFYTGEHTPEGPLAMELVRFENTGDEPAKLRLKGTPLFRTVPSGEALFALRLGGDYLSFLPRAALVGDTVLRLENGRLCWDWKGDTEYLETSVREPVCWCHSNIYGTLVLGQDGALDEALAWLDPPPRGPVVLPAMYGEAYMLLLANGELDARPVRKGWGPLIGVCLGPGSAGALDLCRRPLGNDGRRLIDLPAAELCVREGRYICLTPQGETRTDSGLALSGIWAVAICEYGYLAAGEAGVALYSFENKKLRTWPELSVAGLIASDRRMAWSDAKTGKVGSTEIRLKRG